MHAHDLDPAGRSSLYVSVVIILIWGVSGLILLLTSPSSSTDPAPTTSSECTAEDLADGACLTWDDVRELEWHTETP